MVNFSSPKVRHLLSSNRLRKMPKKVPGVGKYDMLNSKKSKILGNYLVKDRRGATTDNA